MSLPLRHGVCDWGVSPGPDLRSTPGYFLALTMRVLFDRFHYRDMAIKVVGVGSVGTMCMVALFMASDEDSLFL